MNVKQEREYGKIIALADIIYAENHKRNFSSLTVDSLMLWSGYSKKVIHNLIDITEILDTSVIMDNIYDDYYEQINKTENNSNKIGRAMGFAESFINQLFASGAYIKIKCFIKIQPENENSENYSEKIYRLFFREGIKRKIKAIDYTVKKTGYPVDVILQIAQLPYFKPEEYEKFKKMMLKEIGESEDIEE